MGFFVRSKLLIVVSVEMDANVGDFQNGLINVDEAVDQRAALLCVCVCVCVCVRACVCP